jgi:hypothetical protein
MLTLQQSFCAVTLYWPLQQLVGPSLSNNNILEYFSKPSSARLSAQLVSYFLDFTEKKNYLIPCFSPGDTDRSRAEKLWLVCRVMDDVIPCDRERYIHPSEKI